ncbi:GNAT family N-acetyltransferase [Thermococcus sp.]
MPTSFKCPECGASVKVEKENIVTPLSTKRIKILLCPRPASAQHVVRVKYSGKWERPEEFLISSKNGLYEVVPKSRDEVAHYILRSELIRSNGLYVGGAYISNVVKAKILWKDGQAVGYYSEFVHLPVPVLAELYVRPKFRNRGYATEMVKDFLNSHPGPVAFYHIHKKCIRNILMKVGLVKKTSEGYIGDKRLCLLDWQANPIPFWEKED